MAYLAATVLDAFRLGYAQSKLDALEHRQSKYGILQAFQADTPNLVPAEVLMRAKKAGIHGVTIPVIKKKSHSIKTTRQCAVIDYANESAFVTLSFATVGFGFNMIPSEYGNNYIGYQDDFNRKLNDGVRDVLTNLDAACYTKLNTDKSVINAGEDNPWPVVGDTFQIPSADQLTFLNELGATMDQDDFSGPYQVIGSPRLSPAVKYMAAQGQANQTNLIFQFGDYEFYYSNRMLVPAGDRMAAFVAPKGSLGFIPWVDPDAQMGNQSSDGKVWSEEFIPQLGFNVGMMFQSTCGENSAKAGAGMEQSMIEGYSFFFDYALLTAYNSDSATLAGPVKKITVAAQ